MKILIVATICLIYCSYVAHGDWDCRGMPGNSFNYGSGTCSCQTYTDCDGNARICGKDCSTNSDCPDGWVCTSHGSGSGNDHKHCEPMSTNDWCINPTSPNCPCMASPEFQSCPAGRK